MRGAISDGRPYRDSNADVADGGIRKVRARTRFAQQSVPGHSLRYDLSAPPPASQVFATGVASAKQTREIRCGAGGADIDHFTSRKLSERESTTGCRMLRFVKRAGFDFSASVSNEYPTRY